MTAPAIPFAKGHGTGNDFVILTDLDGSLALSASQVRRLCDRRHGIGGDGVLVVTATAACPEVQEQAGTADYFMDYRNADGSVAEMCGNGSRVFVRFLLDEGLVERGDLTIATRGGPRPARVADDGSVCVDMGTATTGGPQLTVQTDADGPGRPALGVHVPNPHAVCWVDDLADAGELTEPPIVSPAEAFPDGVNVEFVTEIDDSHISMRVHERGVGETQSCGTGACAAAVATLVRRGERPGGQRIQVDVPGGRLQVVWRPDGEVELSGPAVIVARGTLEDTWWRQP